MKNYWLLTYWQFLFMALTNRKSKLRASKLGNYTLAPKTILQKKLFKPFFDTSRDICIVHLWIFLKTPRLRILIEWS